MGPLVFLGVVFLVHIPVSFHLRAGAGYLGTVSRRDIVLHP